MTEIAKQFNKSQSTAKEIELPVRLDQFKLPSRPEKENLAEGRLRLKGLDINTAENGSYLPKTEHFNRFIETYEKLYTEKNLSLREIHENARKIIDNIKLAQPNELTDQARKLYFPLERKFGEGFEFKSK